MSGKIYLSFGAALLAVLLIGSLALAQQGRWTQERGYGPGWTQLDEQQQQELLERRQAHHEQVYPKRQHMIARQAELNALLASPEPDQARIEELKQDLVQLNQEIFEMRLEHRIQNRQELGVCPGKGFRGKQNRGVRGPEGSGAFEGPGRYR